MWRLLRRMVVLGNQAQGKSLPQLKREMDEAKAAWDAAIAEVKRITDAIDSLIKEIKKTDKPEFVAKTNSAESNKKQVMQDVKDVRALTSATQIDKKIKQLVASIEETVETNTSGKGTDKKGSTNGKATVTLTSENADKWTTITEDKSKCTKHLLIADGVTSIGANAFANKQLTSVSIPASVTSIDPTAFGGNSTLKKVMITGSGAIADNVFFGDFGQSGSSAITLVIENGITEIENYAFSGNQLAEVILLAVLYNKRGNAFGNNPSGLKFYEYDANKANKKGARLRRAPFLFAFINCCACCRKSVCLLL